MISVVIKISDNDNGLLSAKWIRKVFYDKYFRRHSSLNSAHNFLSYTDMMTKTQTHTYIYACVQTHIHVYIHTYIYTHAHVRTKVHVYVPGAVTLNNSRDDSDLCGGHPQTRADRPDCWVRRSDVRECSKIQIDH